MKRLAVFASGSGTNFQAIVDAVKRGELPADLALLVCDRPGAKVIERAERENVPTFVFSPKDYPSKAAFESEILRELSERQIEWIALAGYMRLIGPTLLSAYEGKIVNIHPSLLPAFPGKDAIGQAYRAGVLETGVTIHYVDEGMDTGPVIAQRAVPIVPGEPIEALEARIHAVEHELYPAVLRMLLGETEQQEERIEKNGSQTSINQRV
ncbi:MULTISPECIES: phosphoribosylglycinamide formyltransferase [Geobacillus]|jgi:phosphoribosylglycinamide formyltransferase 1|uniref:phosphoribosylglycinamide formyltransferase n=1 Tax=Geobacillus TaxID=129337 RepID=UPI0009C11994|nr:MULTISPECIES: phosphoribosylglycinamide formyltransferase [Geobacillus]ATO37272.1 phosphoribosylglycinamide formyltransferase [Geobacillus thermodenitrificans]MED0664448.1 phosphoribosylglycinamide formyltransferase [Geobacillus thermodenitrificans]OQP09221.1 phosphoribosylglycinamide formyltransferase [Geobacillus sp. 47C-IIb]PJW20383.1 phosphoribosylglycinamide formyltransferase [Geobacillus thermodenitrificans]QNU30125.1 phosphoribosylglycinamide formyltransferase [Geobacillus sp. 47C-II